MYMAHMYECTCDLNTCCRCKCILTYMLYAPYSAGIRLNYTWHTHIEVCTFAIRHECNVLRFMHVYTACWQMSSICTMWRHTHPSSVPHLPSVLHANVPRGCTAHCIHVDMCPQHITYIHILPACLCKCKQLYTQSHKRQIIVHIKYDTCLPLPEAQVWSFACRPIICRSWMYIGMPYNSTQDYITYAAHT